MLLSYIALDCIFLLVKGVFILRVFICTNNKLFILLLNVYVIYYIPFLNYKSFL